MTTEKRRAYQVAYRAKNKEHITAQVSGYRDKHKDVIATRQSEYYQKNKERIAIQHIEYREKNKARITAQKASWREKNRENIAARKAEFYMRNRERLLATASESQKKRLLILRTRFYDVYGLKKEGHEHGVCTCCKEADLMDFGTVSHIDGNGAQHRKLVGRSLFKVLQEALAVYDPARFAAECWNCNSGAAHNGGVCPHKAGSLKSSDYHVVVQGKRCPEQGGQ